MNYLISLQQFILPMALIIGSIIAGLVLERIVFKRLHEWAEQTSWQFDEILIKAMRGMPMIWAVAFGFYSAGIVLNLDEHINNLIGKILMVIVILSITTVLARIVVAMTVAYAKKVEGVLPSTSIFINLAEVTIYGVGILIILQSLGISITPILTALGVGGIAVALALQETLSNLFSGLHILLSKQIRTNDYVKLSSGEEGYITDITWRNTTIKALANNIIVVPNSKIASAIITNYALPEKEMSVLLPIGVSYDSDLKKVERVTIEVAKEVMRDVTGGIPDFEPAVRFNAFADFSINFNVIVRAKEFVDQYMIRHELIKRLHQRYQQEGIEIPFPIRTMYIKDLQQTDK